MKVDWPAGMAATGLLASSQTPSKRSLFSGVRSAWLARKASAEAIAAAGPEPSLGCFSSMLGRTPSTQVSARACCAAALRCVATPIA